MNGYLKRILNARIYDVAVETPLEVAPNLSARTGNNVLLKREDMQPVFSFKLRGAYNKMAQLTPEQLKHGVIAASAGNHAQGVALSAQILGCKAVIVMPTTTPQIKIHAVAGRGAKVVLYGDSYSDAYLHALELEQQSQMTFVHPYDDPDVIAGQGTIAMEILRQHTQPIHAIFVPIRGLRQGIASRHQNHRRAAGGFRCDAALGKSQEAHHARACRAVRRWRRGQAGRQRDLPAVPQAGG
jgi:threonine dehydratase